MTTVLEAALMGAIKEAMREVLREELGRSAAVAAPAAEPELEPLAAAAKRFGVSQSWLKERIKSGALPVFGRDRMRRVRPADVRQVLGQRAVKKAAPEPSAQADRILTSITGGKR